MLNSILSVPDHCLFIKLNFEVCMNGYISHISQCLNNPLLVILCFVKINTISMSYT